MSLSIFFIATAVWYSNLNNSVDIEKSACFRLYVLKAIISPYVGLKVEKAHERIQSFPLKRVFPLIISAMIQPTDQMSTGRSKKE